MVEQKESWTWSQEARVQSQLSLRSSVAWGELFNLYESHLPIWKIGDIKLYDFNKVYLTLVLYNQLRGPCHLQLLIGFILKNRKKYLLYSGLSAEETYVKKLDIS